METDFGLNFNNTLDSLRKNLLDMSLRNNLLNFKEIKRTIKIVDENIGELFDILVINNNTMEFLPKIDDDDELNAYGEDLKADEPDNKWEMPTDFDNIPDKHKDLYLQTSLTESELQKRLFSLFQYYNMSIQESGYNTVYLALGFLKWKESESEESYRKAPLILIPIRLYRNSIDSPFGIEWNEDDISLNITLKHKLLDQNVNLPTEENILSKDDLNNYLNKVKKAIDNKLGWYITNEIYISPFNFKKFVMYNDLDLNNWSQNIENEEIGLLFGLKEFEPYESFDVNNIDRQLQPLDTYNVVDADSSQIAVIEDVKRGQSLVVEGPPGTGKSQTIVNLIAELIANNKSVLFVSEKRAALEVVKRRMDSVELGDYCLKLYDNSVKNKQLLNDLNNILLQEKFVFDDDYDYRNLQNIRTYLNDYLEVLQSTYGLTNISVYDLIGLYGYNYQQLEDKNQKIHKVDLPSFKEVSNQQLGAILNGIDKIAHIYAQIEPINQNPWRYTDIEYISPDGIDDIKNKAYDIDNYMGILAGTLEKFCSNVDLEVPNTLQEVSESLEGANLIVSGRNYEEDKEVLEQLVHALENYQNNYNFKINDSDIDIGDIKEKLSHMLNQQSSMAFSSDILFKLNVNAILNDFRTCKYNLNHSPLNYLANDMEVRRKFNIFKSKKDSLIKSININYRNTKRELGNYLNGTIDDYQILREFGRLYENVDKIKMIRNTVLPFASFRQMSDEQIITELEKIINISSQLNDINYKIADIFSVGKFKTTGELQYHVDLLNDKEQLTNFINENDKLARDYFSVWNGLDTNFLELKSEYEDFKNFINKHGQIMQLVSKNSPLEENLQEQIQTIEYSYNQIMDDYNFLNRLLKFTNNLKKSSCINLPLKEFNQLILQIYLNISSINDWIQFKSYCTKYSNEYTAEFIELIKRDEIQTDAIVMLYEFNYANNILKELFEENEILKNFNNSIYENNIEVFKQLDEKTIELNRKRVRSIIDSSKPDVTQGIMPTSPLGILEHEINKKRKHKPIRQLLSECKDIIAQIMPCFLMTPLSISQYLSPQAYEAFFDYVIFDEASQVRVEDAMGALLRAKHFVIIGDTKQLPPTSFFDVETNIESDEDMQVQDVESILHFCKTVLPYKMLKYHYRSRHDSLIAVSNKEFYNNELFVYPSATIKSNDLGLKFNYNPDSVYDRGSSRQNKIEAGDVIDYAIEHVKKYGNEKSLGIGTFSLMQTVAIQEQLEFKLKDNPELEEYFNTDGEEGFFIKNIENIQGDQRDVILISIGYGFDNDGKLSMNFGPLNREGGERRLNVLTTRAKEKCVVFSNVKSSDINITNKTPFGIRVLKTYLYYAEHQKFPKNQITQADFDSDFEKAVYDFLTNEGYHVAKQVGCAGYRIDLAIVDENNYDEYILAIECDGASYHNSPTARDRDRIRQNILEGLGWRFHRIWSTDWYHNRSSAKETLLKAIRDAVDYKYNAKRVDGLAEHGDESKVSINAVEMPANEGENLQEQTGGIKRINPDDVKIGREYVYYENEIYCGDFLQLENSELLPVVADIIKIESPIHKLELYDRIRLVYDAEPTVEFMNHVDEVLNSIELINTGVYENNDFYFNKNVPIVARMRKEPDIRFISDEEIVSAIYQCFAIDSVWPITDLFKEVALLFGFKNLEDAAVNKFEEVAAFLKFSDKLIIDEKNDEITLKDTDN